MSDDLHKTTQDLIVDYYSKDRKRSVAILLLATVGVATVIVSAFWLYSARTKLDVQQKQILSLQEELASRTQDIQNQIHCVGQYFTQTDRANIRIPSLDSCTIERIK